MFTPSYAAMLTQSPPTTVQPQNVSGNVVSGFQKLAAYGLAYIILISIGSTKLYGLSYGIEGVAILGLLLTPQGSTLFTSLSSFLSTVLKT